MQEEEEFFQKILQLLRSFFTAHLCHLLLLNFPYVSTMLPKLTSDISLARRDERAAGEEVVVGRAAGDIRSQQVSQSPSALP